MRFKLSLLVLFQVLFLTICLSRPDILHAQDPAIIAPDSRARYVTHSDQSFRSALPVKLPGGSTLTLISPQQWRGLSINLLDTLQEQHSYFDQLFGTIPPFTITLLLMSELEFFKTTGAPLWTTALYYRGRIIIPLSNQSVSKKDNLTRSIKHEYTHAIVHALSNGRCPGWIDEGLAQWAEGTEHPALAPALIRWLHTREPIPLAMLQNGFTRLNSEVVAAAYAQSYFAFRLIIAEKGFIALGDYLRALATGEPLEQAFKLAFNMDLNSFEKLLFHRLKRWQKDTPYQKSTASNISKLFLCIDPQLCRY